MRDDPAADELLDARERRPPNRLLPLLLAAAFVAVVLAQLPRRSSSEESVAPVPRASAPTVRIAAAAAATSDHVVFVDGYAFVTRGHALVSVRSANGDNPQIAVDPTAARYVLAGDAGRHLVWVVGGTHAQAFDPRSLAPRTTRIALPGPAADAVVLDGALYVASSSRIVRIVWRAAPVVVARTGAARLAADPTRHRVLALAGSRVSVLGSPTAATLPVTGRAIAVVSGTVWAAGPSEVLRLDPRTLRPVARVGFGTQVVLAAAGRHSLLVGTGAALSCVSVDDGAIVDGWSSVARPLGVDEHGAIYSLPATGVPATVAYNACPN